MLLWIPWLGSELVTSVRGWHVSLIQPTLGSVICLCYSFQEFALFLSATPGNSWEILHGSTWGIQKCDFILEEQGGSWVMCLLSHFTFISSNSVHFLCSYLEAHLFSTYYMRGAVLGPGDRAENWNPCPSGAQAKERTYLMVSSAMEKNETRKGILDRTTVMC